MYALAATAGDLIGATTFESFSNQDKPTTPPKAKPGMRYGRVFGDRDQPHGPDPHHQEVTSGRGPQSADPARFHPFLHSEVKPCPHPDAPPL